MELLKLHELSRPWFYVGFICDSGCKSTVLAIKSLGLRNQGHSHWPIPERTVRVCENRLLNLKDCEHEKKIAALAILYGSGD